MNAATTGRVVFAGLQGGLGNQMFQYAYGLAVARALNADLVLDTTFFRGIQRPTAFDAHRRQFELDAFAIRYRWPRGWEKAFLNLMGQVYPRARARRLYAYIDRLFGVPLALEGEGSPVSANRLRRGLALHGYWQSFRAFEAVAEDLRRCFVLRDATEKTRCEDLVRAARGNAALVGLHVRRGDYLIKGAGLSALPLDMIRSHVAQFADGHRFLVCSNDPAWCRQVFDDDRFVFVDGGSAAGDIYAMSLCDHNIIANSSFSWWSAWLNANPEKGVVAPSMWHDPEQPGWRDLLIPPEWVVI